MNLRGLAHFVGYLLLAIDNWPLTLEDSISFGENAHLSLPRLTCVTAFSFIPRYNKNS